MFSFCCCGGGSHFNACGCAVVPDTLYMNTDGANQWGVQLVNELLVYGPPPAAVVARPSYPGLGGGTGASAHGALSGGAGYLWWSTGTFDDPRLGISGRLDPDPYYIVMGCGGDTTAFSFSLCRVHTRDTNSITGVTYVEPSTQVNFNGPNSSNRCSPFSFNFGFTSANPDTMTLTP